VTYRSSASQVSTFELCPRKWAWLKLDGLEDRGNKFSSFGKITHAHLEGWFDLGVLPPSTPEGAVARAILTHLPPPQTPGIEVEKEIRIKLGGVPFLGYIDLRILDRDPRPFVSDHKTTSDLRWAKSPDELVDDVAATLYAYDTMITADVDEVDLQWTYGTSRGVVKTLPVCRTVTFDEIRPRIDKTDATAQTMREIFDAKPPAIEVPYDAGGCEAFGGCPFRDNCNLSPQERIRSIMTQGEAQGEAHSSFLDKLKRARSAQPQPHPAPVEAAPAQPQPHPAPAAPVPTAAGTVNPPEAPAEAAPAPAPPPEPEKPKRRKRRTKAEMEAARAAEASTTPENAGGPPADPPVEAAVAKAKVDAAAPVVAATAPVAPSVPPKAPEPAPVTEAPAQQLSTPLLTMFNRQYVDGFNAGVAVARELLK
jgi:hypothetical protein